MHNHGAGAPGERVRLLIISDQSASAVRIQDFLRTAGDLLSFEVVDSPGILQQRIAGESFDAVVCKQPLQGWGATPPIDIIQASGKQLPVIVVGDTIAEMAAPPPPREGASEFILSAGLQSLPWTLCRVLSEKARGEEEVRRREQANWAAAKWNVTFDTVSDSVMVLDAEQRIQHANRATAALLGVDIKEIRGKRCYEIVHGSTAPPANCPLRRMLRSRRTERSDIEEPRLDGIFDVVANPLLDAQGVPSGCVHVVRDITDRTRVERALRQSEEKYRAFFQQNLAGNYISAPDGRLLDCNSAFLEMFGFTSVDEAKGVDLRTLYADPAARQRFVKKVEEHAHIEHYEKELRRKDGHPLFVSENALGVFDAQGRLAEIRGFLLDETERRRAEMQLRQVQRMDALGRLAGGVAHDYSNLLTIINGFSEILLDDKEVGPGARSQVRKVLEAGRQAAILTRQLLAFSRKQFLQPTLMDLNRSVVEMQQMFSRLLPQNIELRTRLEPGPTWVHADRGQIEQVILNLVTNARDAMPGGGKLTLETSAVQVDEAYARVHGALISGPYVRLTVTDTGREMDKLTQAHIFEPFFTTGEPEKGAGLGLATVYGIVKQSGGHVLVHSEPGMGSSFEIHLPAVNKGAEAGEKTPNAQSLPQR